MESTEYTASIPSEAPRVCPMKALTELKGAHHSFVFFTQHHEIYIIIPRNKSPMPDCSYKSPTFNHYLKA